MSDRTLRIKIIGLGSPHGDDQAGWQVIRKVEQEELPENIELLSLDRPGPALLGYLRDCDRAILIDACMAGWTAGAIKRFSLQELLDCAELQGRSSHQLGIADSLQLAMITGHELPDIQLFAIQIEQSQPLQPIGDVVASACNKLSHQLLKQLLIDT
ncbi:hydrogenase maturation protease [Amphritea sp. HPY]|uniref:hydrogenase maturation protease n=1 Tax=Amphritea sp. HPY TaxID=3421652 RepID=UPI003D7D9BF9